VLVGPFPGTSDQRGGTGLRPESKEPRFLLACTRAIRIRKAKRWLAGRAGDPPGASKGRSVD
jgi:hypothetical protein